MTQYQFNHVSFSSYAYNDTIQITRPSTSVPLQRPQTHRRDRKNKQRYTILVLQPITYLASSSLPTQRAASRSICKALSLPLYNFVNVVDDVVLIPSASSHLLIFIIPSFIQTSLSNCFPSQINRDSATNHCNPISPNFNESKTGHFQKQQTIHTD